MREPERESDEGGSPWSKRLARLKAKGAEKKAKAGDSARPEKAKPGAKKRNPRPSANATVDVDTADETDTAIMRQHRSNRQIAKSKVEPPMNLGAPWSTRFIPTEGLPEIELVARLSELSCSVHEAALFFRVTEKEVRARLLSDDALLEAWNRARAVGKIALRRLIRWHAERPNGSGVVAALALAREELGFKGSGNYGESLSGDHEKAQSAPRPAYDYSRLSLEELEQLHRIQQKLGVDAAIGGGDRSDIEPEAQGGTSPIADAARTPSEHRETPGDHRKIVE